MPDPRNSLCGDRINTMNRPLLYRAAQQGIFGKRTEFSQSSITDALFVYLDGEPEDESIARVDPHFRNKPLVCLTKGWEEQIMANYPDAAIYRRTTMKPACRFNRADDLLPRTWCYCTLGYSRRMFGYVFGKEVRTELISSVRQGDAECRIKITIQDA